MIWLRYSVLHVVIVAKGGITSVELARRALDIREAFVLVQIIGGGLV